MDEVGCSPNDEVAGTLKKKKDRRWKEEQVKGLERRGKERKKESEVCVAHTSKWRHL
jgi:hypothetical protein